MAITKDRKNAFIGEYQKWLSGSQAVFFTEYTGLTVKQLEDLRAKMREAGAEYHVVKNTLGKLVFKEAGYDIADELFHGSTGVGFAFEDSPAAAKVLSEFARSSDLVRVKGGYLGKKFLAPAEIKALAELPPLPVVRSQLLGVLQAPAGKLVRTLAEPGRQIAAVIKAFSEREIAAA